MTAVIQQKLAVAAWPRSRTGGNCAGGTNTAGANPLKLRQRFAIYQGSRELSELLFATQAHRTTHRLALRIEQIQLGDAVDVITIH